ncbi:MAG: trimeric intracellular cation channel family protein [Ginsengibacter sp.]
MKHEFLQIIDILGTVAFAVSGVYAALQKRLDVFGVLIIAFITAIGGGTVRDMMIGDLPVSWIRNINYSLIILSSVIVVIIFKDSIFKNFQKTLLVFDSIGLGFFTILGLQKGLAFGLHPGICIALGTVTGCFGGIIRDISLNNIPLIFEKEIYATACIVGGSVYILLGYTNINVEINEAISILIVFLVRILSVHFQWELPSIYKKSS